MNWLLIVALLGLTTTLVVHVISTVWWASKINTTVEELGRSLVKLWDKLDGYVKRTEYELQVLKRDTEIDNMKNSHNDLRNKFEDCRAKEKHGG